MNGLEYEAARKEFYASLNSERSKSALESISLIPNLRPAFYILITWVIAAGSVFIHGKLRNDGRIARDTERVADALEQIVKNNYLFAEVKESGKR
jgi:hypothetical protein